MRTEDLLLMNNDSGILKKDSIRFIDDLQEKKLASGWVNFLYAFSASHKLPQSKIMHWISLNRFSHEDIISTLTEYENSKNTVLTKNINLINYVI